MNSVFSLKLNVLLSPLVTKISDPNESDLDKQTLKCKESKKQKPHSGRKETHEQNTPVLSVVSSRVNHDANHISGVFTVTRRICFYLKPFVVR